MTCHILRLPTYRAIGRLHTSESYRVAAPSVSFSLSSQLFLSTIPVSNCLTYVCRPCSVFCPDLLNHLYHYHTSQLSHMYRPKYCPAFVCIQISLLHTCDVGYISTGVMTVLHILSPYRILFLPFLPSFPIHLPLDVRRLLCSHLSD